MENVPIITRKDLVNWMKMRKENCLILAAQRRGEDRDGWLEDAAYFEAAVLDLEYLERNNLRRAG
jgi:hypothetical protein